jgi:hypothetical protein
MRSASITWADWEADDDVVGQPAFSDDNWAVWRFRVDGDEDVARSLHAVGATAILAYTADGLPESNVVWTSPDELVVAAERLKKAVNSDSTFATHLLDEYEDCAGRGGSLVQQFCHDLDVIAAKARYAASVGRTRVTLELA